MPKLKIGQYCAIKVCKISSPFDMVNLGILACEICPKMTFLDQGLTLGPPYLITVGQIQVKLLSTHTYPGKVLLQSIASLPDFPLSSYSPLKLKKKKY